MLTEKDLAEIETGIDRVPYAKVCPEDIDRNREELKAMATEIRRARAGLVRLNKIADWLAQAAASGAPDGVRRSAQSWREEAERMVDDENR